MWGIIKKSRSNIFKLNDLYHLFDPTTDILEQKEAARFLLACELASCKTNITFHDLYLVTPNLGLYDSNRICGLASNFQ